MVTSPKGPSSIRPAGTNWSELWQYQIQEVANSRQSEPQQELADKGKQRLRAMPQIAHTDQVNKVISQCENKRSVHFQMHSTQFEEFAILHLIHG